MKIGIISDTHNNVENLTSALQQLSRLGVSTLIHCGDVTDLEMARYLLNFQVILTFGNGDYASGEIRQQLLTLTSGSWAGLVYSGELGGVKIAATHGHLPGKVDELVRSGEYAYVFKGHSHTHCDVAMTPTTRLINPGALGGMKREPRHFCVLDLGTGAAEFIAL